MNKQQGMTLLGMLFTLAIVIFSGLFLLKTIPVYIENYTVRESIKALKTLPPTSFSDDNLSNVNILKSKLNNQLEINSLNIPAENIKIEPISPHVYQVSVKYTVIKSLFANISLLYEFNESEEVNVGSQ